MRQHHRFVHTCMLYYGSTRGSIVAASEIRVCMQYEGVGALVGCQWWVRSAPSFRLWCVAAVLLRVNLVLFGCGVLL